MYGKVSVPLPRHKTTREKILARIEPGGNSHNELDSYSETQGYQQNGQHSVCCKCRVQRGLRGFLVVITYWLVLTGVAGCSILVKFVKWKMTLIFVLIEKSLLSIFICIILDLWCSPMLGAHGWWLGWVIWSFVLNCCLHLFLFVFKLLIIIWCLSLLYLVLLTI